MEWLLEKLGLLVDTIMGERKTVEHAGYVTHRQLIVRPDMAAEDVEIGVKISKITYMTIYERPWIPNTVHSVYHVLAFAPDDIRATLDHRLFEPQVYPLLCNTLLKRSKYPHLYALHAFIERLGPINLTIKCAI